MLRSDTERKLGGRVKVVSVDFTSPFEDRRVLALADDPPLVVGDGVLAEDGYNFCYGRVAAVEDTLAYLALDWDTWGVLAESVSGSTCFRLIGG